MAGVMFLMFTAFGMAAAGLTFTATSPMKILILTMLAPVILLALLRLAFDDMD